MEGGNGGGERGRRGLSKFTSDQGAGRAKLAFVDKGALRNTTVRKSFLNRMVITQSLITFDLFSSLSNCSIHIFRV